MLSKDEIIRMAEAAGFEVTTYPDGEKSVILDYCDGTDYIERFASLVSAHTQEQCAKVCEEELEIREKAGLYHPEDSESRSRCFAAARAARNCLEAIRAMK